VSTKNLSGHSLSFDCDIPRQQFFDAVGDPSIPSNESGHNWGGQGAVDTSAETSKTNDPQQVEAGVANLAAHEAGHEVTPFHPSGDPVMNLSGDSPNLTNPTVNFGPGMQKALQDKYNKPNEIEETPPTLPPPPPPPISRDKEYKDNKQEP
jgi:hypothetical protein